MDEKWMSVHICNFLCATHYLAKHPFIEKREPVERGYVYLEFGLMSGGVFQLLSETVELHLQLVHPTSLHSQHLHLLRERRRGERDEGDGYQPTTNSTPRM